MAKKAAQSKNQEVDSASKIEAIKNLIFGENIEQYDSEFHAMKRDIQKKKDQLDKYIDEVRAELMQSIDSLNTDVNIRITELEDSLREKTDQIAEDKVGKKELGKLLISLGEKLSS